MCLIFLIGSLISSIVISLVLKFRSMPSSNIVSVPIIRSNRGASASDLYFTTSGLSFTRLLFENSGNSSSTSARLSVRKIPQEVCQTSGMARTKYGTGFLDPAYSNRRSPVEPLSRKTRHVGTPWRLLLFRPNWP